MNFKSLAFAGLFLAAPAFSQVIDKSTLETVVAADQIKCVELGAWTGSYVNIGEPRVRISIALDSGDLDWIPVLSTLDANLTLKQDACPSQKEIVGDVAADGTVAVTVSRLLQKISLPTYGNCPYSRIDEKIEVKLASGKVLTSRSSRSLGNTCGSL